MRLSVRFEIISIYGRPFAGADVAIVGLWFRRRNAEGDDATLLDRGKAFAAAGEEFLDLPKADRPAGAISSAVGGVAEAVST